MNPHQFNKRNKTDEEAFICVLMTVVTTYSDKPPEEIWDFLWKQREYWKS